MAKCTGIVFGNVDFVFFWQQGAVNFLSRQSVKMTGVLFFEIYAFLKKSFSTIMKKE
jgi:hypothetical protein